MVFQNVLEAVGNTPLIRLNRMTGPEDAEVLVKYEGLNVGGSIKTRTALQMILAAEEAGILKPDSIIVEPTSGNQGIGLALVGAVKGYKVIIIMPDSVSRERRLLIRQYGAELILIHDEFNIGECMEKCIAKAQQMKEEDPRVFVPNQFENPENVQAHLLHTAKEILAQADGPIDGIGGIKFWGDKAFARSNDNKKLLCFDNYNLYAVLNKLGRGPGEYIYLSDFTYDEKENLIYIGNDSLICVYDAKTMDFIRKQFVTFDIQNLLNVGDKMLYYGFKIDESRKMNSMSNYNSTESVILTDRGEWDLSGKSTVLNEHSYYHRRIYGYPQVFYINPQNMSFCLPGYVNRIVTFNSDSITDVYRYRLESYDSKVLSKYKEEEAFQDVDPEEFSNEYMRLLINGPYLENTYNIIVDNGTISFRLDYYPKGVLGGDADLMYWVHNDAGTKVYKHLRIPGLLSDVAPTGCHDNRNVAIIENLGNEAIDKDAPMSPLAKQIIDELKKQNDDNPVLIEFRFK